MSRLPGTDDHFPIIQYWHSKEMPVEVAERTATFDQCDPSRRHLVLEEAEAEQFIAEHFTDRELAAFRACAVPAMQSDYFSYCAVLALGGIYCDVGFRCQAPMRSLIERTERGVLFSRKDTGTVINSFFLFRDPGHPLLRLALEVATLNIERQAAEQVHMVTGPWIFNGLLRLHQTGSLELPRRFSDPSVAAVVESFEQAVGDRPRIEAAFDGVRIDPLTTAAAWVAKPRSPLRYKQSKLDWVNWLRRDETIFREGTAHSRG